VVYVKGETTQIEAGWILGCFATEEVPIVEPGEAGEVLWKMGNPLRERMRGFPIFLFDGVQGDYLGDISGRLGVFRGAWATPRSLPGRAGAYRPGSFATDSVATFVIRADSYRPHCSSTGHPKRPM